MRFLTPPHEARDDLAVAALMVAAELVERLGEVNNHPVLRKLAAEVVAVLPERRVDRLLGRVRAFALAVHRLATAG
jgi:hypothetical protein